MEKWPFLDQNNGLTPLEKCQFFDFLNLLFLQSRKAFFRSRILEKTFSRPILAKKEKLEKWAFLDQNHENMSIFRLFELLLFIFQKGVFFVLEYHKRHFPGLYCTKKKWEKWTFLDQNHVLSPLEKCQFFDFLNFLFLYPRKAFFRSRIS